MTETLPAPIARRMRLAALLTVALLGFAGCGSSSDAGQVLVSSTAMTLSLARSEGDPHRRAGAACLAAVVSVLRMVAIVGFLAPAIAVFVAAQFAQAQLVAVEMQGLVEIRYPDHGVQVFHGAAIDSVPGICTGNPTSTTTLATAGAPGFSTPSSAAASSPVQTVAR